MRTLEEMQALVHKIEIQKCAPPNILEKYAAGVAYCKTLPEWAELVSGEYHDALSETIKRPMNKTATAFFQAAFEESSRNKQREP